MILPGRRDLLVPRWVPYVHLIAFEGYDFRTATFAMQVRLYRDAPGAPLISLVNAASNAQGLACVGYETPAGLPTSTVQIRINETTIEALLLNAGRAGAQVALVWDLHIEGGNLPKSRWLEGSFIIDPGATQNG